MLGFVASVSLLATLLTLVPPEGGIVVSHHARALRQGEVVILTVKTPQVPDRIAAHVFKKDFSLFRTNDPHIWEGLLGIDLACAPGTYGIRIAGSRGPARLFESRYVIRVEKRNFPVRRLKVEPKYVSPPAEAMERIRRESKLVGSIFANTSPERLWVGGFLRPVPGKANSSFGKRSVFNGQARSPHSGADFTAKEGTPVKAPNRGRVVLARNLYFAGNTIILDHGLGLYSYFAHLSAFKVAQGDDVPKGKVIGLVGATGRVTGPHLHWTVKLAETRVDPLSLLELLPDRKL